ncbi:MAG TPA: hypothetical protein VGM01_11975 [Ktedonobacteraceae bacterium]|jgi:hypothetical protein
MLKQSDQFHSWSVLVTSYASEEVKLQIESGTYRFNMDDPTYNTYTAYRGWAEVWASVRFYRACRDSVADPLAHQVLMLRDSHLVVCVQINRRLRF